MNGKSVLGIIFANIHEEALDTLTAQRTMGSVPFCSRYRLIDFPLSNMVESGITKIGVITNANFRSLMDHVGTGKPWDLSRKNDGLYLLPPFSVNSATMWGNRIDAIFGNIQDEYDNEQEEIFRVSENEFTVDGTTSIDEISDLTDTELPEGDYDTIAGLVTDLLGRIPKENEHPSVQVCGLTITVLEIEDQRLSRLLIVKNDPRRPPEEETHED